MTHLLFTRVGSSIVSPKSHDCDGSTFYMPHTLPVTQPTVSKHWRLIIMQQ